MLDRRGLVLGIDPSWTCTGIVALDKSYELISHLKIRLPVGPQRYLRAARELHLFISTLNGDSGGEISLTVMEDAAYGAPSRVTVAKLKELSGVYKAVLEGHGVPWLELSPSSAKRFITGKGTSEKHIVSREIANRHGIKFKDDKGYDLSDATALAVWGVNHCYGPQETNQQEEGK